MKHVYAFLALVPGTAFAHGAHPPLLDGAHEVSHAGPIIGVFVIVLAIGLALAQRWRS